MRNTARQTRDNRTITVDFRSEATYFQLLGDGKAFLECVLAFVMALGFQLNHKATCRGGGCLTRHSHYVRVRLGGVPIWRIQCTTCRAVFTILPHFILRYRQMRPEVARDALLCVFHGFLPPSPSEGCHSVHANAATQSTGLLPPSPRERCHVDHEGCHPRQAKPAPVGAARRRVSIVSLIRPLLSTWPAVCASTPHARRSCRHYAPGDPESRQPGSDPPGHHASAPRVADW
jgi:hypothetical protein